MLPHNKKAFSLVEVLIAIVIAVLGFTPMLSFLIGTYRLTNAQIDNAFAMNLGDSALNLIRSTKFSTIVAAEGSDKELAMAIWFPNDSNPTTFNVPLRAPDSNYDGVLLTHPASNTNYYLKVELKRIATEADGVTSIFDYGKLGYNPPSAAAVSTYTARYSTTQEIFVVWATIKMIRGSSETTFELSTLVADMGT